MVGRISLREWRQAVVPTAFGTGMTGRSGQIRRTTTAEVCLNEGKTTSLALRGGRPDDWAANRGGCDRISLRRTSMRPKILPNTQQPGNPGNVG
jgi:hypothetical protein